MEIYSRFKVETNGNIVGKELYSFEMDSLMIQIKYYNSKDVSNVISFKNLK